MALPSIPGVQPQADPIAVNIIKQHDKRKANRTNWDRYWKELADYFVPQKGNVYGQFTSGQKLENKLYDSTSIHAVELLASALHGMLTNPSLNWFGLSTGNEEVDRKKPVAEWLEDSRNRMITTLNNSNFQTEIHELYIDLVSFGTGLMGIDRDDESVIRFRCSPIYESYIEEDNKGIVNTVSSEKEWTVAQIIQEFGEKLIAEKCPDLIKKYEDDPECKEKVIHFVAPRDLKSKSNVPKKMAFKSCHVIRRHQQVLRESGYKTQRNVVPRWTKLSNEIYGRSPAMKCLSDVKTLNVVVQSILQAAQLRATPPIQAPDDGLMMPQKIRPASTLFYRAGTKDRFEPLNLGGDLGVNEKLLERITANVSRAFFIDQLQLQQGPQMTATEVNQRSMESLRLLSPILGRLHNELLKPIIDRVFEIMFEAKMFEVLPPEFSGVDKLEINYTSQIAKAQKESELDAFPKFLQAAGTVIQLQPQVMDNINGDEFIRHTWNVVGLPEKSLYDENDVRNTRQARAQQAQQQQAAAEEMHNAEVSSKVAPNMLKAQEMQQGPK
jgi:hypothetical protein